MARSSRPPALAGLKRALSGIGASALVAGAIVGGGASAATAAPATFNPFDINNGFTTVAKGDITLNNGEIEGSVAAFGSISSGKDNYPVIHNAVGEPDYTVPTVDGTPVRILADEFTGKGSFNLTNRDDSNTIATDSPEANAVVKLVNTDGLQGGQRGNFLRLTNSEQGNIDLEKVPYAGSDVENYKTKKSSVAEYFSGIDAQVKQTNQCLASMYDSSLELTHAVDLNPRDGMLFPSDFAKNRPNVINYADIAGKTIKMDNADGYVPTADAPLVIRVAKGTTSIGPLNFEGWSPQKGAQQKLARYIMLDMSDVTGDVTIDGLALGAIWAPNASLHFNSGVTTNGQWFAGGKITSNGGGEIHHHTFLGKLPCGDQPTEPVKPSIGTTVAVDGSDEKVLPLTGGTVIDTVAYEGLTPGETYVLKGEVRTAPEGEETGITATAEFTPEKADGTTTVKFEITGEQVAEYAGQDLVVFEYLTLKGEPVAEHADPKDEAQTFTVEEKRTEPVKPSIGTTVAVEGSDEKVLPLTGGTVIDTVAYEGLTPGETYVLNGEIRTAPAGDETGITATAEFTPKEASGTTTVTFEITAEQVAEYAGQDLVVFEYLTLNGDPVAEHTDPKDEAQTFTVEEEEPTVPVDPTDPKDPDDPTDPTVPDDPTDPTVPDEPTDPKDPKNPGTAGGNLPQTGASVAWPLLAGGVLLLAGGTTLLLMRRKAQN